MFLSLNLKLRFQRVAAYPVKLPRVVAQNLFDQTRRRQIFARSHLLHIDFIQSQQEIFQESFPTADWPKFHLKISLVCCVVLGPKLNVFSLAVGPTQPDDSDQ